MSPLTTEKSSNTFDCLLLEMNGVKMIVWKIDSRFKRMQLEDLDSLFLLSASTSFFFPTNVLTLAVLDSSSDLGFFFCFKTPFDLHKCLVRVEKCCVDFCHWCIRSELPDWRIFLCSEAIRLFPRLNCRKGRTLSPI